MSEKMNEFDIVTGLPLYDSFINVAKRELDEHFEENLYVLVSTDISNFKYINHIYGYNKANELLKELIDLFEDSDMGLICSCRTHSDHIISLFKYGGDKASFVSLIDLFSHEFVKKNARKYVSVTLHLNNGIFFIDNYDDDIVYCIDKANVARRVSKGNYCVTSVLFSDDMLGRKEEDAKIIAMFDNALKNNSIYTYFQPKVDITSGELCGAEVLSRIKDLNGNTVYPGTYIPVLENSGKIVELDRFIMRETFATIKRWLDCGYKVVPISVNLSRMHFYNESVADRIINEFKRYEIPSRYIEIELTESLFFADSDMIVSEIGKLRDFGFKVSMDDFGVGYSTLNALGTLPVDVIKFDKGFVDNSMDSDAGYQILLSLIQVFKKINYDVICEGIETKEQEKLIFECGCDKVQGFLYDKPLGKIDFEEKYLKVSR